MTNEKANPKLTLEKARIHPEKIVEYRHITC